MKATLATIVLLFVLNVAVAMAAPEDLANRTWIDPERAAAEDPSFSIQGEYGVDREGQPWGVQVVALGDGAFDAYLYEGGLPGLGWDWSKERTKLAGSLQTGVVRFASADKSTVATIRDGKMSVGRDGETIAVLNRIQRKSLTLGAKPPEGAVVLFDGTSADAWIDGRMENGLLANSDIASKAKFGDFALHLEFRTPYKPFARGQQRGNSGVYYQGRYETQVLDSFGLEGDDHEAGGIYSIAKSRINMCFPPLSWQTYDVDFTAARFDDGNLVKPARITVRLNGVIIHQDQELPHTTTAAPVKEITREPGPIFIQHHGNPVFYRNIWLVPR